MKFTVTRVMHKTYEPDNPGPSPCEGAVLERLEYTFRHPNKITQRRMGSVWTIELNNFDELIALRPVVMGRTTIGEAVYDFGLPHLHLYPVYPDYFSY